MAVLREYDWRSENKPVRFDGVTGGTSTPQKDAWVIDPIALLRTTLKRLLFGEKKNPGYQKLDNN